MADADEKERRRKKQHKRMEKILTKAWQLDESADFQEDKRSSKEHVLCLATIGQKLDSNEYKLGRHGWEHFAKDLGGVYNRHIKRKTKKAETAKQHLETVKQLLSAKDESLGQAAASHVPSEPAAQNSKKRKSIESSKKSSSSGPRSPKHKKANTNKDLADREDRAMDLLSNFIEEKGGSQSLLEGFTARVTKKSAQNKYDTNYFNAEGRRFRSMLEVGRFFKLVKDGNKAKVRRSSNGRATEGEAERKRLRKELERLRKAQQRATKALDDFAIDDKDTKYPIDDRILMEEEMEKGTATVTQATCAAARVPDITGFTGIPDECVPDVLMTWDFLCTFHRALSLSPIALDDFASALVYTPPEGQIGDDVVAPPIYLSEAHLSLLKLLLQDTYSDDWWWSTLETDETEFPSGKTELDEAIEKQEDDKPVVKVDIAALLNEVEDPLITASWLRALEDVGQSKVKEEEVKAAIRTALKVVGNKWVHAYLRKTLHGSKTSGSGFLQRAVVFLVSRVREARPDLVDRNAKKDDVAKATQKVIEEVSKQMEGVSPAAPEVSSDDALSDVEFDDEEDDSDESDEEDDAKPESKTLQRAESKAKPASVIPPRPAPSYVDLLLPPTKPDHNSEYVNSFSWSHIVGATAHRILHRKKRLLNEVDDYLRASRELPPITLTERRERERLISSRVLMECVNAESSPLEKAIEHLCSGGNYLQLTVVERLCILRLLVEAAYDTNRLYKVVEDNVKQRTNAAKALEAEQRKAKKEAKERVAKEEAAAREQLAEEAREKFFEEKREEIRKLNERSQAFDDEVMESLTEEDILDFDEEYKADFDQLPTPDSFNKTQVKEMVIRMREEAAFDTDSLRVLTLEAVLERERRQLEELEGQLQGFGGEEALQDPTLDRESQRTVETLVRDISKAKDLAERLPSLREKALEQLRDAMTDGTIKVLRSAITAAKKAKLSGSDEETGGVWAVDLMRDAALELENAKQNKRVLDAQKDLVAKRNKCFIRNDPIGRDRFGNRFWAFENDEDGHVWVETEFHVKEDGEKDEPPEDGFLDLKRESTAVAYGARDMEEDLMGDDEKANPVEFHSFSRREHHSSGFTPSLAKNHWGCHATEESLRAVIKLLDSRGAREHELKTTLKEYVEQKLVGEDRIDNMKEEHAVSADDDQPIAEAGEAHQERESGDEEPLRHEKDSWTKQRENKDVTSVDEQPLSAVDKLTTAIGQKVRVRHIVYQTKDSTLARYETGEVNGWKYRREEVEVQVETGADDEDEEMPDATTRVEIRHVPVWRVATDRGHTVWVTGSELLDSLLRYHKWKNGRGYFEDDASFFAYRNNLGKFCGKNNEAPFSSSPIVFARMMVRKEDELYRRLKVGCFDNTWGGKSGQKALWTNSMKDYAFDFNTARQGLLTLEKAFFELTGEFNDYPNITNPNPDAKALLANPEARHDVELETLEKSVPGLWNSPASRAVFIEIVSTCKTTGFLSLALDLLCRNTTKFLKRNKLLNVKEESVITMDDYEDSLEGGRRTRRATSNWRRGQEPVSYAQYFD